MYAEAISKPKGVCLFSFDYFKVVAAFIISYQNAPNAMLACLSCSEHEATAVMTNTTRVAISPVFSIQPDSTHMCPSPSHQICTTTSSRPSDEDRHFPVSRLHRRRHLDFFLALITIGLAPRQFRHKPLRLGMRWRWRRLRTATAASCSQSSGTPISLIPRTAP